MADRAISPRWQVINWRRIGDGCDSAQIGIGPIRYGDPALNINAGDPGLLTALIRDANRGSEIDLANGLLEKLRALGCHGFLLSEADDQAELPRHGAVEIGSCEKPRFALNYERTCPFCGVTYERRTALSASRHEALRDALDFEQETDRNDGGACRFTWART